VGPVLVNRLRFDAALLAAVDARDSIVFQQRMNALADGIRGRSERCVMDYANDGRRCNKVRAKFGCPR